jgi:hypothetical protein
VNLGWGRPSKDNECNRCDRADTKKHDAA